MKRFAAVLGSFALLIMGAVGAVQAQQPAPPDTPGQQRPKDQAFHKMTIPRYPNATDFRVSRDKDEYDLRFYTQNDTKAVFDYYVDFLKKQGFQVENSRPTKHGYKAHLARGQGGPNDTIELDAQIKHGLHKVEIEFDE